jgi:hypothetical protein
MRRLEQHLIGRLGDYGAQARPGADSHQRTSRRSSNCRCAIRPAHRRAEASRMRRIAANIYQDSTLDDTSGFIELEQGHCCTTHGRQANNLGSCQCKVFLPHVGTRIEQ